MQAKTETRKLKDLKATNPYLRLGTDVSDLEKSIQTVGLIAPIVISVENVILAGARRYQALLNLGYTQTPVVVIDQGELERELISIDENLVRKDLNKMEIEGHLRRAKEIYKMLHPIEEEVVAHETTGEKPRKEILPSAKFLNLVAEKTGLSPKQIHEAINRDEMAAKSVKEARQKGELSISQTNEIVKLSKDDQKKSLEYVKALPVKDIKKFVKAAHAQGVDEAMRGISRAPHAREFSEVENILKRLHKKLKQLSIEGITLEHFPDEVQELFSELSNFGSGNFSNNQENEESLFS